MPRAKSFAHSRPPPLYKPPLPRAPSFPLRPAYREATGLFTCKSSQSAASPPHQPTYAHLQATSKPTTSFPSSRQHNRHHGVSRKSAAACPRSAPSPPIASTIADLSAVRRRLISTSSSSATSTPASRPPPDVSLPLLPLHRGSAAPQMTYTVHRLDLQVRRY